jgi:hypothetical protein
VIDLAKQVYRKDFLYASIKVSIIYFISSLDVFLSSVPMIMMVFLNNEQEQVLTYGESKKRLSKYESWQGKSTCKILSQLRRKTKVIFNGKL